MKTKYAVVSMLFGSLVAPSAIAGPATQPPMNSFDEAYYTCANGEAFLISYDSDSPTSATMTTSNDNKKYDLKRTAASGGFQFSGAAAQFWTDGKTVKVHGTALPFQDCKIVKSGSS
ncbi:MAG TPA: MliC family protein [Caulobacteraceae bacterium]|jgi:membrane-bound inhibitor of C-type lysozyme|nr:MliC family protein [Caulobacteraceae bacterium]